MVLRRDRYTPPHRIACGGKDTANTLPEGKSTTPHTHGLLVFCVCVERFDRPDVLHRNASAEDVLYSTWEPSTHFVTDGAIVVDYVSMVERFAREIEEGGLLEPEGNVHETV